MTVSYLMILVCLLVSTAYLTLLERKVLSYVQIRKGPNKVGILQPWADGLKLFVKNKSFPEMSMKILFLFSPLWSLLLCFMSWLLYYLKFSSFDLNLGLIYFLVISSLAAYGVIMAGWSSNSIYSILGGHRAVAQMISYEVALALSVLFFVGSVGSFQTHSMNSWLSSLFIPLSLVWISSLLAEVNRSPYDLAEGESELVSGFNVEYMGGAFSMLFLAEYGNILFMCYLTSILMMSFQMWMIMIMGTLWVRASYPRMRYDKLMFMAWKCYLPMTLGCFMLMVSSSIYLPV